MNKVEKYNIKYKNLISKLFGGSNNEDKWWEQYENEDYDYDEYNYGYDPDDDMDSKIPKSFNNTTKRESRNEANIEKENYDNLINEIIKEDIFVNWNTFDNKKKKNIIEKLKSVNVYDIIDNHNIIDNLISSASNFDLIEVLFKKSYFKEIFWKNTLIKFDTTLAIKMLKEEIIDFKSLLYILSKIPKYSIDDNQNNILESLDNVKDKFKFDVFIKFYDFNYAEINDKRIKSRMLNDILNSIVLEENTIELNGNKYNLNIFEEFLKHENELEFEIKMLYMYIKFFNSNILLNIFKYYD